ncbi:DNA translocase FtsK 4TM domain-containing protein [Sulfurovum sp. zt1-1]|uniref:DNA translocase FtsK 4TM domain-containing protein n=1 Tax=Sulfurovum zhangzhouensis TaxID=3019067 RepID=A0ABT7QV88_9BACT|nr:DNA translocase FtsK [Sulfurovum zhangzhouensis]MDM5270754.1 DNA translocase FtsK 4TM domain-containing protein [Sulfurovum zhangzhouensis]
MKIALIITSILFIYAAFSTLFLGTGLVGNIGEKIGQTNIFLFGYLAYINLFILFYPLYKLFKDKSKAKEIDFYLGWILLFIGLIFLESLVFDLEKAGFIGTQIVEFLEPYIGKAGLWLSWLLITLLSLVFILDDDFSPKDVNVPGMSLSSWLSALKKFMVALKGIFKKIFTNPFASPKLEDEMMPEMEVSTKRQTITKKPVQKVIKNKAEPFSLRDEPLPWEEEIDDPVIQEITIFEKEMEEAMEVESNRKPPLSLTSKNSSNVTIVDELEENSKLLDQIEKGQVEKPKNFRLPKLDFLQKAPKTTKKMNEAEIDRKIGELLAKLEQFKIEGDVVRTYSGPLVTTFEFKPAPHVKVSKILNLQDDLAMALQAETIRIQAPIPGRDVVGIEIPNDNVDTIYLREILESEIFTTSSSPLTVALGKDIVGKPFVTDIKKLPHILIAGTTGSGKSVGINAMILSLLYRNDPDHLKLMLIDPKMLEFSIYNDIPHLLTPVIIDAKKAIAALANMVGEMERRYKLMAENRTKNIENYNEKVKKDGSAEPFPYIVVVIDELADLMMTGGKEVEFSIARLAQMARASGIHLIVATQRPSVDVVTGLIKANLPSRLSYRVGQRIDSKVILDTMGAESLLGRGDGLFTPPGSTGLVRLHAPWSTEEEIEKIVEYIKAQREPEYDENYLVAGSSEGGTSDAGDMELDPLYEEAKAVILSDKKTSISYLQRKLQIGYNRSANIIEQLEAMGVLSEPNAKGNREIL